MLSTQLENAVIELLSQFISSDFGKLEKLKENQENASLGRRQTQLGWCVSVVVLGSASLSYVAG